MPTTGQLRHTVTIESPPTGVGEGGGIQGSWVTVATVRAMISPLSGKERLEVGLNNAVMSHRLMIHYRADVDETMRANFGGTYYYFTSVAAVHKSQRFLVILAEERKSE